MSARGRLILAFALCAAALCAAGGGAAAEPVADFYKGRTVSIITSTGPGGAYDLAARTLARYLPRYLPGAPAFVVQNMPGAGHVRAANYMYTQAARDGSVIATISNGIPLYQIIDGKGARFDARRFNWIGSTGISNLLTVAWHTAGVRSFNDALTREIVAGATGTGSGTAIYPLIMNAVLGAKFKVVMGYTSSQEVDLAMERGEVAARSGASYGGFLAERPEWIRNKKIIVLTQIGAARERDLPDAPLMHELGADADQRSLLKLISSPVAVGRPFLTAPDVPGERVAALRMAFDAALKDADFLAEARRIDLDMKPSTGEEVRAIVEETVGAPPDLVAKARAALEAAGGSAN